jgi:adenosylcobinamide-phosphate guanylyltransferase
MDALVMCGGRGSRLDVDTEKPLFEVGGEPMIDRVCGALAESHVETVYAATSPQAPRTRAHLRDRPVEILEAPGEGYVADLDYALEATGRPALTVASDLPLLDSDVVDDVLTAHAEGSLTVAVPATLKELLGVSVDRTMQESGERVAPTGLNVVGELTDGEGSPDSDLWVSYDARLAVNVNRLEDARVAEQLVHRVQASESDSQEADEL